MVEGRQLSLQAGRVLEHRRLLDLRQGVLFREWRQQDPSGRITGLNYLRLASLADRHVIVSCSTIGSLTDGLIHSVAGDHSKGNLSGALQVIGGSS